MSVGILVLLVGQLPNKIILFYTGISGIYQFFVIFMFGIALYLEIKRPLIKVSMADMIFAIFFTVILIRMFWEGTTSWLFVFSTFAILPYLLGRLSSRRFDFNIYGFLYPVVLITIFIILLQFLRDPNLLSQDRVRLFVTAYSATGSETQGSTQHFSGALFGSVACLSVLAIFLMQSNRINYNQREMIFHLIIFFLSFVSLFLVSSRSALFSTILICIALTPLLKNFLQIAKLFLLISISFTIVILWVNVERIKFFKDIFNIEGPTVAATVSWNNLNLEQSCFTAERGGSLLSRLQMNYDAWTLWLNKPFFGNGPGMFGVLDCNWRYDHGSPHNLITHLLAELGLTGFALFALSTSIILVKSRRHYDTFKTLQIKVLLYFTILQALFIKTGYLENFQLYFLLGLLAGYSLPAPVLADGKSTGQRY